MKTIKVKTPNGEVVEVKLVPVGKMATPVSLQVETETPIPKTVSKPETKPETKD